MSLRLDGLFSSSEEEEEELLLLLLLLEGLLGRLTRRDRPFVLRLDRLCGSSSDELLPSLSLLLLLLLLDGEGEDRLPLRLFLLFTLPSSSGSGSLLSLLGLRSLRKHLGPMGSRRPCTVLTTMCGVSAMYPTESLAAPLRLAALRQRRVMASARLRPSRASKCASLTSDLPPPAGASGASGAWSGSLRDPSRLPPAWSAGVM